MIDQLIHVIQLFFSYISFAFEVNNLCFVESLLQCHFNVNFFFNFVGNVLEFFTVCISFDTDPTVLHKIPDTPINSPQT